MKFLTESIEPLGDWQKVLRICEKIRSAKGKAYLVGGSVRDSLAGIAVKDFDIEVFGISEESLFRILSENFKIDIIGKSYAVYKIKKAEIDVSIPRQETKIGLGHQAFEIESDPNLSIHEAALRRDFSINAIYYDPLEERFEDPFNGIQDWKAKRLNTISEKYTEDPLRPLRAMQFIARFDLQASEQTIQKSKSIGMENLPKERIFEEWKKLILKGVSISKGLNFLKDCGWIQFFPELEAMIACPQEPKWHPEGSVWNHTLLCMDAFAKVKLQDEWEDLIVGLAILLHDVGKASCTMIEKGRIRSPMHDRLGAEIAESFLERITNFKKIFQEVLPLIKYHMIPFQLYEQNSSMTAVKRLSSKVQRLDRLIRVTNADHNGRGYPFEPMSQHAQWLKEKADEGAVMDSSPQPIIMGRHLIELGYSPNRLFKEILNCAYEAQINESFQTLEEGLEYIQNDSSLKPIFEQLKPVSP